MNSLARELSLRVAREDLKYCVGHLPAEANTLADCLSRVAQPGVRQVIPPELTGAAEVPLESLSGFWAL